MVILLMTFQLVWADSWSVILQAESLEELMQGDRVLQRENALWRGCQQEIKDQKFPARCLSLLVDDSTSLMDLTPEWLQKVTHLCIDKSQELYDLRQLENLTSLSLPLGCRQQLLRQRDDLVYAQRTGTEVDEL